MKYDLDELLEVLEKTIKQVFGENLEAASLYGDICFPNDYVRGLSFSELVIVTKEVVKNLYKALRELKFLAPEIKKFGIDIQVIPKELFKVFYDEGIYPAIMAVHSNYYIIGHEYLRDFQGKRYKNSKLAVNYLLCRALFTLSKALESGLRRDYLNIIRYFYVSIRLAASGLILGFLGEIPKSNSEMMGLLRDLNCKFFSKIIQGLKEMLTIRRKMKDSSERRKILRDLRESINFQHPITGFLHSRSFLHRLLKKAYEVNKSSWECIYKCKFMQFSDFTRILKNHRSSEISLYCLDDKPIIEIINSDVKRLKLINEDELP